MSNQPIAVRELSNALRDKIKQLDDERLSDFCDRLATAFLSVEDLARLSRYIVSSEPLPVPQAGGAQSALEYARQLENSNISMASKFDRLYGYLLEEGSDA